MLEHFQGEARALLHDLRLGDPVAVRAFYQVDCESNSSRTRLADAQYIIARKYGFKSWQSLKQLLVGEKSRASSFPRGDQNGPVIGPECASDRTHGLSQRYRTVQK